jgi:predicted PurR-regulated permease PerM
MSQRHTVLYVLLALLALALIVVLAPLAGTLLWAVIVALLFRPLYRRLLPRVGQRRNGAALLTLLLVVLILILPFALITTGLIAEAGALYERVQSGELQPASWFGAVFDSLPAWATRLLERWGLADIDSLQRRLTLLLGQGSQFIATYALRIGQNTFETVASLFILLYVAYFLIRDGDAVLRLLRRALPLSEQHQRALGAKFSTVIRATLKGNVLVAALQGTLGGLAFWVLGIGGPLLWGVLMAFLSLLPAIGAALVWLPVAIYLLASGQTVQGLGLAAWGVLAIGLVDNLLRPVLVGKDTRLPDWVILVTTVGGMIVFGIHGFVLGPVIAAMFAALWQIAVVNGAAEDDAAAR